MQLPQTLLFLLTLFTTINALALSAPFASISDSAHELFKRKGGGGGGGRGGGGGGRSSSSSSSGGRSGSGSSSSSSSRTSSSSNVGGSTSRGSGPLPSYGGSGGSGGSRYYAGGAAVPYTANGARRTGLGAPLLFAGAGLAVLPAAYIGYSYWGYPYGHSWSYYNRTSNRNETHPAQCMCQQDLVCGCDDNNGTEYMNAVANNASVAQLARINDTDTLVVNGTLPRGTTAPGGTDDDISAASLLKTTGYWPLVAGVVYTMYFM